MKKVPKHKMIAKSCPGCSLQLPIASKTCSCGHVFVGRRASVPQDPTVATTRRRTERVKREKPNYYDALEYDKETRKQQQQQQLRRRGPRSSTSSTMEHTVGVADTVNTDEEGINRLKGKRKRNFKTEQDRDDRDIPAQIISPENGFKCSVILSEINRKMGIISWRV